MEEQAESEHWNSIGGGAVNEKQRALLNADSAKEKCAATTSSCDNGAFTSKHRSHLYHALEGLGRYPNYLQRWSTQDIDHLEASLEEQLTKVRTQRAMVIGARAATRELIEQLMLTGEADETWSDLFIYSRPNDWNDVQCLLDPRTVTAIFKSNMFEKHNNIASVASVLDGTANVKLDVAKLTELIDEE
ncbi:hypothetical protein MPSEU_000429000 [Mayamaea pseudoterrestris]|nr:hypothetical protein MPSEU_000429000 [Mayamaea pseudoterrestris]